jgi:hypothetical protein
VNGTHAPVHQQASAGEVSSCHRASDPHIQEVFKAQKAEKAEAGESHVPEVFKNEKARKAKVDEGQSSEGDDKPFCFRCYIPGHGKLVCTTKLWCDICGSNEHMTGKCPILKQPCLLAHPCGYDVNGLGFYHIPQAPITYWRSDNRVALVTVQGVLSIP